MTRIQGWPRALVATGMLALALANPAPARSEEANGWAATIDRIASGVVTIQIDGTRAFDTEWNTSSQATGFVIDAKRGLILTNRHVVMPGPVTAQAVFQNREEVELKPIYRDPVHDFGLYRYDPAKLRFIKPAELPLYPQGAQIGVDIRVVGNDAGEQLSILAGTLARLDREAPEYGSGKYNDFNTFYYQAASSTSGGSSGSPVIDVQGRVVALNAGGSSGAASSFYLPLDRVVRAVELIKAGKPVSRGTLQTVFSYTPYDQLRRLGLTPEAEATARKAMPRLTGMLVVSEVQPGSAAQDDLEVGDILLAIDGRRVAEFGTLNATLDDSVGREVELQLQRGGQLKSVRLPVEDLHSITPAEFLEMGEAVVHTLSWQMARHMNVPVSGLFIANPGYMFGPAGVPRGAVVVELAGEPVTGLADAERILLRLADGERTTLRFLTLEDPRSPQLRSVRIDRRWFPAQHCTRDDALGYWPCRTLAPAAAAAESRVAATRFPPTGSAIGDRIAPSLVLVSFSMPYPVSGVSERNYSGTGVVVDAARGLVVVDRNTVPVALGDVRLTFAGTLEVQGRVEYVHPLHNLAVVSYDPKLVDGTPVRAVNFGRRELVPGEDVTVVGLRPDSSVMTQRAQVASVDPVAFPLSRTLQFRDANLETVSLVNGPGTFDGVIAGRNGEVLALWSSFAFETGRNLEQRNMGVPVAEVVDMVARVREGKPLYSAEAEWAALSLAAARRLGLPDEWVRRFEEHSPAHRQVLSVVRVVAGSPAARLLRPGDLLLDIDGQVVNRYREVDQATQSPRVRVKVWRAKRELTLDLDTVALDGRDIDRVLIWAGATLQAPHRAMSAQRGIPREGVFVSYFLYGSPASRHKLFAGRRITEVDGTPVADLDAFIAAVKGRPD
ncbi:MAG: trypsin-like peptidase domain-containing protein, partial [Gammaproteobacteria bacterium]|nr:trypsin-like peptidase domain-containing protein [Gammaproteobacteria bacterium]